ncbi:MAG: NapC/NirT family cytochrome c [Desulfitobacteriaceae bacterium]
MGKRKFPKVSILLGIIVIVILIPIAGWKGIEYTSSDAFCVKCHVMKSHRETAYHTVHRAPQVNCKDCHLPQDNVVRMLGYKAYSGAKDIYSNVVGPPAILRTTAMSKTIIQSNCIRCHSTTVQNIVSTGGKRCFECHREVPHGN